MTESKEVLAALPLELGVLVGDVGLAGCGFRADSDPEGYLSLQARTAKVLAAQATQTVRNVSLGRGSSMW